MAAADGIRAKGVPVETGKKGSRAYIYGGYSMIYRKSRTHPAERYF